MKRPGKGWLVKRGGIYHVFYKREGKRYTQSTGMVDKKDAKVFQREFMAKAMLKASLEPVGMLAADVAKIKEAVALKIDDVWSAFVDLVGHRIPNGVTLGNYRSYWYHFERWLKVSRPAIVRLRDVGVEDAEQYAKYLRDSVKAGTFNKHKDLLSRVFKKLARQAQLVANPWEEIERLTSVQDSRRELTVEELRLVCDRAAGEMRLLFGLGIYTGMRLGDCATLEWSEVDLERRLIRRVPSKTKRHGGSRPVLVPVHDVLGAMMRHAKEEQQGQGIKYVLPQMQQEYSKDTSRMCRGIQAHFKACGVRTHKVGTGRGTKERAVLEVGFHSLRHTFVSLCRASNAPLSVVESIVGHSNPSMTRHYTHVGETAALAAVSALPWLNGQTKGGAVVDPLKALRELLAGLTPENSESTKGKALALLDVMEKGSV